MASYGFFGGGSIGNLFAQWEAQGVFTYLLPFLLIFALVFVILSNVKIFAGNKGINAIISLSVALMSLQFNIVGLFFSEIFPRLGIALSVILVIVILGSLFIDPEKHAGFTWVVGIAVFIIIGIVIFNSLQVFNFNGASNIGAWLRFNGGNLVIAAIVIGGIVWAVVGTSPESKMKKMRKIHMPVYEE